MRRIPVGRGAIAHPPDDALQDGGDTKEIIGEIDIEIRDAGASCL